MRACPFGTTGKKKPDTYTPCLEQLRRHILCELRLAKHNRDDRMFAGQQIEAEIFPAQRAS